MPRSLRDLRSPNQGLSLGCGSESVKSYTGSSWCYHSYYLTLGLVRVLAFRWPKGKQQQDRALVRGVLLARMNYLLVD